MMKYLAALALFAGLIVLQSSGHATQPPAPVPLEANAPIQLRPATKTQRAHYTVRYIDATTLARVVSQYFKGEAEVLSVPAASGTTLLISGSPDSIGEVMRLLEQLDRKPRTVEVEIVIADITSKKGTDGKEVDVSGLEPLPKLEALKKAGQVEAIQRIKLTTVEGHPITSTTGGNKPIVSGAMVAGGGGLGGDSPGAFKVIRLKNIAAEDAVKTITEVFNGPQQAQRQGGGLGGSGGGAPVPAGVNTSRVRVVAENSSNSLVVINASPIDLLTIEKLVSDYVDRGITVGGGKGGAPMMRRSITYHETGTTVKLTARIGAEDVVTLDLNVQDSKIRAPEAGDELGAAAFDNNTLNTKLNVSPGKAVAAQAVRTEGKTGGTMSLVIVTAHVVEPGAGKSK
jgi:hypothetical protein